MRTTRAMSSALAGGYDLDPDLPKLDVPFGDLAGLHVLRHLQRYLDMLGMHVLLVGGRESVLTDELTGYCDQATAEAEFARYRAVSSPSRLRAILRDEPRAVPLFAMSGSQCVGWKYSNWEGVRIARYLRPGQLFGFFPSMARQSLPKGGQPHWFHLAAWQAPFPTHSLVTWGNNAELMHGPQEIEWRVHAAYLFAHCGQIIHDPRQGQSVRAWFDQAEAEALAAAHGV